MSIHGLHRKSYARAAISVKTDSRHSRRSQEAVVAGVDRGVCPVPQAHAGQDAGYVVLDRTLAEEQGPGDLAVVGAAGYQAQDIDLACRQRLPGLAGTSAVDAVRRRGQVTG